MNLSPLGVEFFAAHGLESVHWSSLGLATAPDRDILQHAASNGWVVFIHDLDFGTLLSASGAEAPSVIQIRGQDVLPSAIGEAVVRAIESTREHLQSGALVTVDLTRHRLRILPIRTTP